MKAKLLNVTGNWRSVADAARTTIGMEAGTGEPSSSWKKRMLRCEHSPTRKIRFNWIWEDIMYWVSVHFTRHKFGIEHWVSTQRDDRTKTDLSREEAPQGTLVIHEAEANAQALINISRKRLCFGASPETRAAWIKFLEEAVKPVEPEVFEACVPDCIYRNGFCPEFKSCGYNTSPRSDFKARLKKYQEGFEAQITDETLLK